MQINKCLNPNCNYEWLPRNPNVEPKSCPRCKTYDWNNKQKKWKEVKEND